MLNKNSLILISEMYLIEDKDTKSFRVKKGILSNTLNTPGTLRRFEKINLRLSKNYFIPDMPFLEFKNSIFEFTDEFEEHLQ